MERTLYKRFSLFWGLFITVGLLTASAQSIEIFQDTSYKKGDVSQHSFEIVCYAQAINNTGSTQELIWEFQYQNYEPYWDGVALCDPIKCYSSMVDSQGFQLADGDTARLDAHFYHNDTSGMGEAKLALYVNGDSANHNDHIYYIAETTDTVEETGIRQKEATSLVSIHPNPAARYLRIQNQSKQVISEVHIYNILGKKVDMHQFATPRRTYQIEVTSLPPGRYFVRGRSKGKQVFTKSFTVVR